MTASGPESATMDGYNSHSSIEPVNGVCSEIQLTPIDVAEGCTLASGPWARTSGTPGHCSNFEEAQPGNCGVRPRDAHGRPGADVGAHCQARGGRGMHTIFQLIYLIFLLVYR